MVGTPSKDIGLDQKIRPNMIFRQVQMVTVYHTNTSEEGWGGQSSG
jgi:hypothetical protein